MTDIFRDWATQDDRFSTDTHKTQAGAALAPNDPAVPPAPESRKAYGECPPGWVYSHHEGVPIYGDGGRVDSCPLVPVYVPTDQDRADTPPDFLHLRRKASFAAQAPILGADRAQSTSRAANTGVREE